MNYNTILDILKKVKEGKLSPKEAYSNFFSIDYMKNIEDSAVLDYHRPFRTGFAEAIFGEGKSTEQLLKIVDRMYNDEKIILITRMKDEQMKALLEKKYENLIINEKARIGRYIPEKFISKQIGSIAVVTGGSSDYSVAEESSITAETMGSKVERVYDVGIAGIHRLFSKMDILRNANVIVAVAGMEGALPSVVAGLVTAPVIAVPTSVGYGASFGGISALLTMLNSCAPGISVVNIDNGYGAGYQANLINILIERKTDYD